MPLTPRQRTVLATIVKMQEQLGRSPTQEEIGNELGLVKSTVNVHMTKLERAGAIERAYHHVAVITVKTLPAEAA